MHLQLSYNCSQVLFPAFLSYQFVFAKIVLTHFQTKKKMFFLLLHCTIHFFCKQFLLLYSLNQRYFRPTKIIYVFLVTTRKKLYKIGEKNLNARKKTLLVLSFIWPVGLLENSMSCFRPYLNTFQSKSSHTCPIYFISTVSLYIYLLFI